MRTLSIKYLYFIQSIHSIFNSITIYVIIVLFIFRKTVRLVLKPYINDKIIEVRQYLKLYPHDYDNFVIIVPNLLKEHNNLINIIIDSPLVNVWAITICIVTIVRCIFKYILKNSNDWMYTFIETYGISFGTTSAAKSTKLSDQIIVLFLSIFSLIAGIFCSGILFQQYATVSFEPRINTLDDIAKAQYHIFVPREHITNETKYWLQQR